MNLCDETITVFNAKYDPETDMDAYEGTVISGVSWFRETASTVDSSGLRAADKVTVRIPEDADFGGKQYVTREAYTNAQSADGIFTLQNGDIVVRGTVSESGLRPAELHENYEAFTVLGVTDNRRGAHGRHWKVIGA